MRVTTRATILEPGTIATTTLFNCSETKRFRPGGALGATTLPTPVGGTFVSVGARVVTGGNLCNAGKNDTRGYFFLVHANATWTLTKSSQHILAAGRLSLSPPLVGKPLELAISVRSMVIEASVNGASVVTAHDGEFKAGFAAMAGGWHRALFSSVAVDPLN